MDHGKVTGATEAAHQGSDRCVHVYKRRRRGAQRLGTLSFRRQHCTRRSLACGASVRADHLAATPTPEQKSFEFVKISVSATYAGA
jgi:hypothetical protein